MTIVTSPDSEAVGRRRSQTSAPATAGFRPEIQGLRALAVLLVVGYHLYPNRLSGGFVGVDVFFVISGFLITSHLYREAAATGRVSIRRFWARRARRLLPAALVVLAASVALTATVVPSTLWDQTVRQIRASTLYVENWALAGDAVDYSAAGNVPTLAQHFWSLSVEEQFYAFWPVLVLLVALASRRWTVLAMRTTLAVALGLVVAASLWYSVTLTSESPGRAYFVTPTRVWEFALGALLALLAGAATAPRMHRAVRTVLAWAGALAIVWAAFAYSDRTPFPGSAALLPVLGTVAVIAAGASTGKGSVAHLLSQRPATFVGDISYSVYLWHWPLVVVVPYLTGVDLRTQDKAGIFAATILLAWASTTFVERPLRKAPILARAPWRTLVAAVLGMGLVLGGAQLLRHELDNKVADSRAQVARALASMEPTGCVGPAALDPKNDCSPPYGEGELVSPPEVIARQNSVLTFPGCHSELDKPALATCTLGETVDPTRTVAIVGDSHAIHWFSAMDRIGKLASWKVVTHARSSCPFTLARRTLPSERNDKNQVICDNGNDKVLDRLLADNDIDTVFVSAFSSAYGWTSRPGSRLDHPAVDGFHQIWEKLTKAGKRVVVLRDVPAVKDRVNTPDCLAANDLDVMACTMPRSRALVADVEFGAARKGAPRGVSAVDLSDLMCDQKWCYPVVGGVIVYRDYSHLSAEFSTLLAPYLAGRL